MPFSYVRTTSATLSTFPWSTSFIIRNLDTTFTDPIYAAFVQSVLAFEKALEPPVLDAEGADFYRALAIVPTAASEMPDPLKLNRFLAPKLCSLMCSYKLLDVIYNQENPRDVSDVPRYAKLNAAEDVYPSKNKYWPLRDWVVTLREAEHAIKGMEKLGNREARPCEGIPRNDVAVRTELFKALHTMWGHKSGVNILLNFQVAALHLSYMLIGNPSTQRLAIPNLPDNISDHMNLESLTSEESSFLRKLCETSEVHKLRHPLYAALLFSPMYLLATKKVMNLAWDQEKMMLLSKSFGNSKPSIILRIERVLWKALLDIATGRNTVFEAILDSFSHLPSDEIAMVDDEASTFFAQDATQGSLDHLLSIDSESSIPNSWPLAHLRPTLESLPRAQIGPHQSQQTERDNSGSLDSPNGVLSHSVGPRSDTTRRSSRLKDKPRSTAEYTKSPMARKALHRRPTVKENDHVTLTRAGLLQPVESAIFEEDSITFDDTGNRQRVKGEPVDIIGLDGRRTQWIPEFHFQSDLDNFMSYYRALKRSYKDGEPLYISDPDASSIRIMSYSHYQKLSEKEVQDILVRKNIVLTEVPTEPLRFDEEGSQVLKNLDAHIEFQDQSIPIGSDHSTQIRTGTLEHILESSRDPRGPILNALSFPLPLSAVVKSPISSEIEAWMLTESHQNANFHYPTGSMRWGLASTAGSRHWNHIDSDGLGTFVEVRCGAKWWYIISPIEGPPHFQSISDFLTDFDVIGVPDTCRVEAVYLTLGSRLIMRPNTPHAVFTHEHTIVVGGHFYSFSSMPDTLYGIVHACVLDSLITNTEHPDTRFLLFRMMECMYKFFVQGADAQKFRVAHLPDLSTSDGFMSALSLCTYCIMANVLDCRTYSFPGKKLRDVATKQEMQQRIQNDVNALSPHREYFSYIRGLALNFVQWLHLNYDISIPTDPHQLYDLIEVVGGCILNTATVLLKYKIQAEKQDVKGFSNCTAKDLQRQLELLYDSGILECYFDDWHNQNEEDESFSIDPSPIRVVRYTDPYDFEEEDPIELGTTMGDILFFEAKKTDFILRKNFVAYTLADGSHLDEAKDGHSRPGPSTKIDAEVKEIGVEGADASDMDEGQDA